MQARVQSELPLQSTRASKACSAGKLEQQAEVGEGGGGGRGGKTRVGMCSGPWRGWSSEHPPGGPEPTRGRGTHMGFPLQPRAWGRGCALCIGPHSGPYSGPGWRGGASLIKGSWWASVLGVWWGLVSRTMKGSHTIWGRGEGSSPTEPHDPVIVAGTIRGEGKRYVRGWVGSESHDQ